MQLCLPAGSHKRSLSQIILDEITATNTFGMEEHARISVHGEDSRIIKRVKKELKFSDFLGLTNISPEDGYPVLENVETMGELLPCSEQTMIE